MFTDLLISTLLFLLLLDQLRIKELSFKLVLYVVRLIALFLTLMDQDVQFASFTKLSFLLQIFNSLMLDLKEKQNTIFNQKRDACFRVMRSQETILIPQLMSTLTNRPASRAGIFIKE